MVESLKKRLERYIEQQRLFGRDDKVLLTVSGGVDSMVMLALLYELGYNIGVAHCNFGLRDQESDEDQALVEDFCKQRDIPIYIAHFDTKGEIERSGDSTQMVARRLRYEWFEKIRKENNFDIISIAHHADDSIETFFINLFRGTGLRGLTGITNFRGYIVRPLLFCSRREILDYSHENKIAFREDSSNSSKKYLRNKIRLGLIPRIREINPKFTKLMCGNIRKLSETQLFIQTSIERLRSEIVKTSANQSIIDPELIDKSYPRNFVLYELLCTYGFKGDVVENIARCLNDEGSCGKRFYSKENVAYIDRGKIIIEPIEENDECEVNIPEFSPRFYCGNSVVYLEKLDIDEIDSLSTPETVALLDYDKLHFPLSARKWRDGDNLIPLGLDGHKKVSDILIDAKVSLAEKKRQFVLCDGDQILWLMGRRIDDRYKITKKTETVLKLTKELNYFEL